MTAAFDLLPWRDAATSGGLPVAPRTDRWQPLRAGVVNLWEYDAAEVWYADGRLQLQGANESGKSTLMTLTTLLLIAGDISSHNIDTLGQNDKRFKYYVEPTGHALDRRDATQPKNRGWAWLEFGRGDEFFTLLLFAESRRADGVLKIQWCTAHGSVRVRDGLAPVNAGVVADPAQFRDLPGFTQHRSGTAYREEIARTLHGRDSAWLDQVIRILRVVRTPQIGHRLDLKFLTDAFRVALPPIADDEINQLADGWEQLQRLRDERDTTDQALAAVTEFTRQRWRPWADAVIRAAADPVAAAASNLTGITRDEKSASDALATLTREVGVLDERLAAEEEARRIAAAQREALRESQAFQDAVSASQNAQQLAERADSAEEISRRSRQRTDDAQKAIAPAQSRLGSALETFKNSERAVQKAVGNVAGCAEKVGLVDVTAQFLPGRDTERLLQAARLRVAAAQEARRRIDAHAKAVSILDAAADKAREARRRSAKAQREAAERERGVENAITAVAELLSGWARVLDERIRPTAELVEDWIRRVSGLTEADKPAPVLAAAVSRDHLIPVRRPLDKQHAELDRALRDNAIARASAEAELANVTAERDPRPRDPEFWLRRDRPDGVSAEGAPLWRLVEKVDQDAQVAQLEAAMDAAGLLQTWITPDGAYLPSRDRSDTVWTTPATQPSATQPGAAQSGAAQLSAAQSGSAVPGTAQPDAGLPGASTRSLRAVLRPADDAGPLAGVVARLLASIGYGEDLPAGETAISENGRWRHGGLTGSAAPAQAGPRLLGAAARAADRARRIAELHERLNELTAERNSLTASLTDTSELLAALDTAAERLPGDSQVVSAILNARQATERAQDAAAEADLADEAESTARSAADSAAAEVAEHCAQHDLPRGREDVEEVLHVLADYQSMLSSLVSAMSLVPPLRGAAEQAAEAVEQCRTAYESAAKDAASDNETALSLRAKADAARAALTQEAQQIMAEVGRLRQRVEEAAHTLKRLGTEHQGLTTRRIKAETILEQIEERRKQAETERQRCADRWLSCIDSQLPRLRGLEDPAARHVTAALESARAARAKISIRDWPDDPAAAAHRVQNQWARMTEAVAMLRSRLESLAGRTVRTVAPGDGAEDFPGAVEVVVDSTGAALAPPTAVDRLSAMLLRLRTDYDEELTKTINELLGSTFIEHLRDRLAEAERLRSDINVKLAQNPTSVSGLTLRLIRVPVSEERAANDVLAALERDFSLLPETTQEQLRAFLAGRVSDAQEKARAAGDPDWRSRLAEILDYRRWFELRMEYRTARSGMDGGPAGGWRALDRGDHGLLSGG
ncbi:MAG: hypothetical protein ACRDNF_22520, partial [Streptosporangiaceae bacterium]